jgi:hypothetical protein
MHSYRTPYLVLSFAFSVLSAGAGTSVWTEQPGNPVIRIGQAIPNTLWNDPTVVKEGTGYRMWLSGGDLTDLNHIVVKVYSASSSDGLNWFINQVPCISPDMDPAKWDGLRIETPSVVKVNNVYHMYYSGTNQINAQQNIYSIGHAVSTDGQTWTKDPANPIVTGQTTNRLRWAYQGVGEPGVVYNPADHTFYLYYAGMKYLSSDPTLGQTGVLLSKSRDGSKFTPVLDWTGDRALVLSRNVPGAIPGSLFGYTGPSGYISPTDGKFHLFCVFLVAPGSASNARQVALAHATSPDGLHFTVIEDQVFVAGQGDWKDQNVRSPSPLEDNGIIKLWFAGDTYIPYFGSGIGFASR